LNEGATASSDDIPHGSSSGVVQLADLQRILTGLGQTPGDIGMAIDRGPGFSELLKPDIVVPLLENLQLEERLAPYLPEGVQSKQAIAELMQSPQFHQQLDSFTQVLRSGQMDLSQFGIDPSKCEALYDLCQQGE
jgi:26S proteasome regulatory subunit N13